MKAFPELTRALMEMLDRMDASLRASGYDGPPVQMYVAGGVAVNYYCGSRFTEDVDAHFSARFLPPRELVVSYRRPDGSDAYLYFDHHYTPAFALVHDDFEIDSREWEGIGNERRLVQARVLSPLDLAVSKVARFSEQDRNDIALLAAERYFTADEFGKRAYESLGNYIGDRRTVEASIDLAESDVRRAQPA